MILSKTGKSGLLLNPEGKFDEYEFFLGWRKGTAFCGIFPQRKKGKKMSRGVCIFRPMIPMHRTFMREPFAAPEGMDMQKKHTGLLQRKTGEFRYTLP